IGLASPRFAASAARRVASPSGTESQDIPPARASAESRLMGSVAIRDIFAGRPGIGASAVVEGWVRTRRDSKAGISFLQVHDGSCFDPLQVVAESSLPNYEE